MHHLSHAHFIECKNETQLICGWKYPVVVKSSVHFLSKVQQVVLGWWEPSDTARLRQMIHLGSERREARKWREHRYMLESQRGRDGQIGRRTQMKAVEGVMVPSEDWRIRSREEDKEVVGGQIQREWKTSGAERRGNWKKMNVEESLWMMERKMDEETWIWSRPLNKCLG